MKTDRGAPQRTSCLQSKTEDLSLSNIVLYTHALVWWLAQLWYVVIDEAVTVPGLILSRFFSFYLQRRLHIIKCTYFHNFTFTVYVLLVGMTLLTYVYDSHRSHCRMYRWFFLNDLFSVFAAQRKWAQSFSFRQSLFSWMNVILVRTAR